MKKSLVALLLALGAAAFVANLALAGVGNEMGENLQGKVINASLAKELQSRAARLGTSATSVDTTYVGYTPGHGADNYWSIWSGSDKFSVPSGPYHRPPAQGAMWDFEPPYPHGDSLQGFWSIRNQMTGTGGLTIPDDQRPWRCLDYGNIVNYSYGKRTFGVVGVWHADAGNTVVPPASTNWTGETDGGIKWAPLEGARSAWMGLRRHGDASHVDPITGNPYDENTLFMQYNGSVSTGGTDKKFPGYGSQMDQLLYRDIQLTAGETSLSVSFTYRTSMSTGFTTTATTRSGWFVKDPLAVLFGGADNNFIQNNAANPAPPVDSFMVYVGAPAEGSVILSDGLPHTIYDAKRRWAGEVIRMSEGPGVPYKQVFSKGGTNATSSVTVGLDGAVLASIKAATSNKVRLVFRVKTNQSFDDEGFVVNGYSSGGVGAVVLDAVTLATNLGAKAFAGSVQGLFNAASDIDNNNAVDALNAWKSTGKPPAPYHHVHQLDPPAGLVYQDLCGQPGNPARICDMDGQVVSAGNHENSEASGGTFGTAEQEPFQGIVSPVMNLAATGLVENNMGLNAAEADATDDYYIDYELYTGIFDFFNQGNAWRFGFQAYPAAGTASGAGQHKRWGEIRYPGFIYFNPDKQCFRNLDAVKGNGLLRTTNASTVPDSCRIYVGTRQEAYRFGIPVSEWFDGAYWDNLSLAIVDGAGADPVSVDIWQLYHDSFPANDNVGLPGLAAFDTTSALIKSGINISPTTGNTSRFAVPGDTTVVIADGDSVRVDMVFRILPGPGNYVNPALGKDSQLKAVPTAAAPIPTPASGVANFWSNYMFDNGTNGSGPLSGGLRKGHPVAASGPLAGQQTWSPHVWNSARCDTAEVNNWALQKRSVLGGPADVGLFMSAYHETELGSAHRGVLGIARNICFVADTAASVATVTVICGSGNVPITPSEPGGATHPPLWARTIAGVGLPAGCVLGNCTTKEGTKIIPDGLLTPGAHVEYFFRRQDGSDPNVFFCPDTDVVTPQNAEGSTDGHRWQEFGVLPDRWKSAAYLHPVLNQQGSGGACMLYVDQNDRRGNERTWVGVADSIGATAAIKYGAHNGWHAAGDGDVNDPAGFVRRHIGMPGTTWDMYGVKASESLNTGPGSLGSRGGISALSFNDPANTQINGKTSRLGPSEAMLNTYYKVLLVLSGDLNSSIFGPINNKSQNDYKIMQDFLLSGDPVTPNRGIFLEGDGLVEAMDQTAEGFNFMTVYLGVELRNVSYLIESGNTNLSADILPTSVVDNDGKLDVYGLRNACTFTLDVLDQTAGLAAETDPATYYEPIGGGAPYISGVRKEHTPTNPWISLVDGWDIEVLRSQDEISSRGRLTYFYNVFSNVFNSICTVRGTPVSTTDSPDITDGRLFNFMSLANNPMKSGSASIAFGLTKTEKVKIQVFDVSGRLVRTLADRSFAAGEHKLTWDGVDNGGKLVERGVYFVRSSHAGGFTNKLVVLK